LSGDSEAITVMLKSLEQDRNQLEQEISNVVYYMNGGLNYTTAWQLSTDQLNHLANTIKTHFDKQNEAWGKANSKSG
jgi:DNA replication protein DnaD